MWVHGRMPRVYCNCTVHSISFVKGMVTWQCTGKRQKWYNKLHFHDVAPVQDNTRGIHRQTWDMPLDPHMHWVSATHTIQSVDSTVNSTSPWRYFKVSAANWWVTSSKLMPLTASSWSPICSLPSLPAAPSLKTRLMKMGRSPWGLPFPPTMVNPRPDGPRCSRITWILNESEEKHYMVVIATQLPLGDKDWGVWLL